MLHFHVFIQLIHFQALNVGGTQILHPLKTPKNAQQVVKTRLAPHQFHRRVISHIWLWVRRCPSNFTPACNLEWMLIREFAVLWHSCYHPFLLTNVLELSYRKLTTSSRPKIHYDRLYPDFTVRAGANREKLSYGGCAPTFVWKRTLRLVEDSNWINEWHRYVIYCGRRLFPVVLWRKFSLYRDTFLYLFPCKKSALLAHYWYANIIL